MRIIIVGDGKVGYTLAEHLSREQHDVVIIDKNTAALRRADDALDVLCIEGSGASVRVLQEADAAHADLLIAATSSDEMNMVCCLLGRKLGARHTVARVRDPEYTQEMHLLKQELGLTMAINPELSTAKEIARILCFPQVNHIEPFAHGKLELAAFRMLPSDSIVGKPLVSVVQTLPPDILFCAVERSGELLIPNGDTTLLPDDIAHVIGPATALHKLFKNLGRPNTKVRDVLIVGGGRISYYLSRELAQHDMSVKIIELDKDAALSLSSALPEALVIHGDGTDQTVLQDEGLEQMDAFVALTDRDEENLMVALYAHARGLSKVIAKINRINYADIIHNLGVDSVVSPKLLAADAIVRYVRALANSEGSPIETLVRIVHGKAEALEFSVCPRSSMIGQPLRYLPLKSDVLLAALIRAEKVIVPRGDTVIQAGDHVIAITRALMVTDLDGLLEDRG